MTSLPSSGPVRFSAVRTFVGISGPISVNNVKVRAIFQNFTQGTKIKLSESRGKTKFVGYLCGTVNENETLTLSVPIPGVFFNRVDFASYGNPSGSCNAYSTGWCHSGSSVTNVQNAFLNKTSGSISANNSTFGDPCPNYFKTLYVQLSYGL
jgi:hypothetical protein